MFILRRSLDLGQVVKDFPVLSAGRKVEIGLAENGRVWLIFGFGACWVPTNLLAAAI